MRGAKSRRFAAAVGAAMLAAPLAACGSSDSGITINVFYAPEENFQEIVDNCTQKAGGRYKIVYQKAPRDADGQREQMVRRLAAEDTDIDVMGLDTVWTAEFAGAGWVEEWTGANKSAAEEDVLAGPLESAKYKDKLYAATKNTNVQLLWYRSDLVPEPPATWDEMIDIAKQLKQQGKPHVVAMHGAQYEGYVVQFNTLVSSFGGKIVNDDGTKAEIDDGAMKALELLKEFADSGVTDPSFSNAKEQQVQLAMEQGRAAFELNWPYVYAAMQKVPLAEVKNNFKWARYPSVVPGQPSRVTAGGYNLAVSKYSLHKQEAFEAVLCLRSADSQRISVAKDALPPTLASLYDEAETEKAYPMKDLIKEELEDAANRPVTPAYQNISTVMSTILSPPNEIDPQRTAERLRQEIQDALDSKGVLP